MFVVKRCRSKSRWKFPETHPSGADKLVYILAFAHTCREGVRTKTYRVSGQDENKEPSIHLSTLGSLLQQVSDLGHIQLSVENVVLSYQYQIKPVKDMLFSFFVSFTYRETVNTIDSTANKSLNYNTECTQRNKSERRLLSCRKCHIFIH